MYVFLGNNDGDVSGVFVYCWVNFVVYAGAFLAHLPRSERWRYQHKYYCIASQISSAEDIPRPISSIFVFCTQDLTELLCIFFVVIFQLKIFNT